METRRSKFLVIIETLLLVKIRICVVLILFLSCSNSFAQIVFTSRVVDSNNKPIQGVNLILYPIRGNLILNYSTSDKNGNFNLSYQNTKDSLRLEASCIGYLKKTITLTAKNTYPLTLQLESSNINLREILIKENRNPISKTRDTINYNVKAFSDSSDRVIIDVIKKLPGITVTTTGQILYNNKAINKFYIEGKDLLENRYNIASNNLPSNDVEQVQVIPNHQPIKLLDGDVFSDRAAINIKLKKDAKLRLLGIGDIGIGAPPSLREDGLTLLKFSKNLQFINTFKSNNTGINLDPEISEQNYSTDYYESNSSKQDLVSVAKPGPPPISQNRYWFNDNNLIYGNYLISLNRTFDLKVNTAFENDIISQSPNALTRIYLPKDTINIKENNQDKTTYSKFVTGLILEANTKNIFLKNNLRLQHIWSKEIDLLSPSLVNQDLKNPFTNVTNDLNAIVKLKNNIVGFSSYTSYSNLPQRLTVTPGLYTDSLNSGQPFNGLLQRAQQKTFFTNNNLSVRKKIGIISINNTIGALVQTQVLTNDLYKEHSNIILPIADSFQNVINKNRVKFYDDVSFTLNKGRFNTSLSLKSSYNTIESESLRGNRQLSKFFGNPELNMHYNINPYFESNVTFSTSNAISDNANASYILFDYRNLINNNSPINEIKEKNISYALIYKNIVRGIFANFNFIYSDRTSNILVYNNYNGILTVQDFIFHNNPSNNLNTSFNLSKYYGNIKTTINLGLNYSIEHLQEIQQGILSHLTDGSYSLNTRINSSISKYFSITHSLSISTYKNSIIQNNIKTVFDPILSVKQDLIVKIFFPEKIQAKLNIEQFYNHLDNSNNANYYFADFALQKSFEKPKIDLSINLTNILDTKSYTNYIYTNNTFISSNFPLRGRLLLFKAAFQF